MKVNNNPKTPPAINRLDLSEGLHYLDKGTYLKKKNGKFSVLNTPRNDLSKSYTAKGNINWKNLLGFNDIFSLVIIVLILISAYAYSIETKDCKELLSQPYKVSCLKACGYYNQVNTTGLANVEGIETATSYMGNFTNINLTGVS